MAETCSLPIQFLFNLPLVGLVASDSEETRCQDWSFLFCAIGPRYRKVCLKQ